MNTLIDSEGRLPLPDAMRGEAAVWLSRLHSDTRNEQTEADFRRWLATSPAHREAFERMTGAWESTANLTRVPPLEVTRLRMFGYVVRRILLAAAAMLAICALLTGGVMYFMRLSAHSKAVIFTTLLGERRSLTLADGSRLELNTNSQVSVLYSSRWRRVSLERGQARFDVVSDASRPFVVRAGERQIVALGTAFDVRWTDERLAIVLVEGRVAVIPAADSYTSTSSLAELTLSAGERLDFPSPTLAIKSMARLDREEAWLKGRVLFESTRLGTAVAEINRYAPRRIELTSPSLEELAISGSFSADDPDAFARAVAQMFSLRITDAHGTVFLSSVSE